MAHSTVGAVFGVVCIFCQKLCYSFCYVKKKSPERMSGSSQTYLFNSNYNTEPSTTVIRYFKYAFLLLTSICYCICR